MTTRNDNQPIEADEYVDEKYLAKHTPIAAVTWKTWRAKKVGPPYYKLGRRTLYKWLEVLAWIEELRVEPKKAS